LSFFDFKSNSIKIPDTCKQPDIYFLLFDEYESSLSLKERYGFDNDIDSFLLKEGFSIQSNSISNYNNTPFSMASILNMEYLPWVGEQMLVKRKDYMECIPRINENRVIGALGSHGYDIVNLSMFDLAGNPSQIKQAFLPVKTKMIAEGTLFPRLYRDFAWAFKKYKLLAHVVSNQDIYQHDTNNQFFIEEVKKHAAAKTARPKFLYAHFYLPHGPYFYDEKGAPQPLESVILPDAYLKYVRYTNLRMKEMIRVIKDGSKSEAIIVILSDHGFRTSTTERHPDWHFKNLNAMYFPDGHYNHLYSDMSNVNTFRAIFNQVFAQNLPMLKDSTIYLIDLNLGDIRRK
ncbi:MAG: sulfatase-like hydrolase/transferase, partial [Chitinophagaceae bacterium]